MEFSSEAKIRRLGILLRVVLKINQIALREKHRNKLIQNVCNLLVDIPGYSSVFIVLLDDNKKFITAAEAGIGKEFPLLLEQFKNNKLTSYAQKILSESKIIVNKNIAKECKNCPLSLKRSDKKAIILRLEHGEKIYGFMCIPTEFIPDKEEQALLGEAASDIAFALHSMELEEKHRQAEKALEEAEFRYRTTLDSMKDTIHVVDPELRFVLFNKAFRECNSKFGLRTDVIGRTLFEIFPFLPESVRDEYKKVFDTGKVLITQESTKVDSKEFITETQKIPVFEGGKVILVVTVIKDITKQKRNEKIQSVLYNITKGVNVARDLNELFASIRKHLNEIIDTTNFVIGLYDEKRDELSVTYKVDEKDKYTSFPLGQTLTAYVIRTGKPLLVTEKVMEELTRAGKVKMIGTLSKIWLGVPLKIGESVVGVITVQSYEDASHYTREDLELLEFVSTQIAYVIERKRADEALKNSEREKRTILDSLVEHVIHEDKNMKILWANRAAYESVNLAREELIGRYCYEIWPKRNDPCPDCPVIKAMETGQPQETEKATPDGKFWFIRGYPERDDDGKIIGGIEVTLDITQRKLAQQASKRAEETLKKSEEKYRKLFEATMDAIFLSDAETGILIDCNSAASELIGRKRSELVGKHQSILYPPERIETGFSRTFKRHLKEKQGEVLETQVITKNGEIKDVAVKGSIFEIDSKKVLLGIFEDITERKRVEAELRESEEKYRVSVESAPYGIVVYDKNGKFLIFNSQLEKITGYSKQEMTGIQNWREKGYPEKGYRKLSREERKTKTLHSNLRTKEAVIVRKDGRERACYFIFHLLPSGMRTIFVNDITERKQAQEQIKRDLEEKNVLLKEIHHRVKNNLQVVSSLLSLQSDYVKDKEALQMFKDSRDRVRSMALVHEKLYGSKDLAKINFEGYIKSLIQNLYRAYGADPSRIELWLDIKDIHLGMDLAIPCGLIINELVSNALKYAFSPSWEGGEKIWVSFRKTRSNEIELIVQDNGVGIPENLDIRNSGSLGMRLVSILAEDQLHGKIKIEREKGTKFQIKFKANS